MTAESFSGIKVSPIYPPIPFDFIENNADFKGKDQPNS
jgi:hypothetical protein